MTDLQRPTPGDVETRSAPEVQIDGRRLRGVVPFNVESRDLGGWREKIDAHALDAADLSELVATVDHAGIPLGRFPEHPGDRGPRRRPALVGRAARVARRRARGSRARRPAGLVVADGRRP